MTVATFAPELERVAPSYQFRERHSVRIRATPERVYRAIREVTADEIFLFRALIWMRRFGRPLPESVLRMPPATSLLDVATRTTFLTLADGLREIVVATVVARPRGTPRPATADELTALRGRPGHAIAWMNFAIVPAGDACLLSTETRVYATDASSRQRFAAYWLLIRAGSGFIRRMWLRAIRRRAEAAS